MRALDGAVKGLLAPLAGALVLLAPALCLATAGEWRPTRNIEVIVGTPAGGPLDGTARLIQKYLEPRHAGAAVLVMNKPGGGHVIAMQYLNQHAGDAHYVSVALTNLLTNRITGAHPLTYIDVTPLALLTSEYIGMWVRADSPIKTGHDLLARMRAQPDSVMFAITSPASGNHIAAGVVLKAAGVDLKRVRFVPYKGSAETTVAVMGGHVDVVMATPGSAWKFVQGGKLRALGVAAPKRLTGDAAVVPTWKELGVNAVADNWRALVGPRGMTAAQTAYWDQTLAAMVKSPEWQQALKVNQWEDQYLNSAGTVKFLEQEYNELTAVLTELGEVKGR
jgi:putative tricarboxylic transport membrane protein